MSTCKGRNRRRVHDLRHPLGDLLGEESVSEELGKKDFGGIVWDEIMAFWLVLIFIMPTNIWMQAIAFALFRFFDAAKPGPIGMIDRHFKNTGGDITQRSTYPQILWRGFGIMVDDLAAAFFTLLIIALLQRLIPL